MKPRLRGTAIVAVLMLISLFFILGLTMLQQQVLAYRGAAQAKAGVQALGLAQAGLEDARIKLEKDCFFPPPHNPDQQLFSYSEELTDLSGQVVGSYRVTVDRRWAGPPYLVLRVTSIGIQGSGEESSARKKLTAEFDLSKTLRTDASQPNPNLYRLIRVTNEES